MAPAFFLPSLSNSEPQLRNGGLLTQSPADHYSEKGRRRAKPLAESYSQSWSFAYRLLCFSDYHLSDFLQPASPLLSRMPNCQSSLLSSSFLGSMASSCRGSGPSWPNTAPVLLLLQSGICQLITHSLPQAGHRGVGLCRWVSSIPRKELHVLVIMSRLT